jgi:hypothetical protein
VQITCTEDGTELSATGADGSEPVNHYLFVDGVLVDTDEGFPSDTYGFSELVEVLNGKGEGDSVEAVVLAGETAEDSDEYFRATFTIDCEDDTPPPPPGEEDPDPVKELAETGDETLWVGLGLTAALLTFGFWAVRTGRRQSIAGVLSE